MIRRALLIAGALAVAAESALAQAPRRSQRAELMQMVGETEIRAMYIRPVARGRALFGALVAYGKVWTPSADSAMRISFSKDVEIQGQSLKAGSYALWAIPDSTRWTFIFSSDDRVFHLRYRESADVLRVTSAVDSLPHIETLTLSFPVVDGRKATMQLQWGTVAASMEIVTP